MAVTAAFGVYLSLDATVVSGKLTPNTWTLVSCVGEVRLRRGITGAMPTDRVAAPGTLEFALRNTGPLGRWSPGHASVTAGFGLGTPVLFSSIYSAVQRHLFMGRIRSIQPDPGAYAGRLTHVVAQDLMVDLQEAHLAPITALVNAADYTAGAAVVAAITAAVRPTLAWTAPQDSYPLSLHDLTPGGSPLDPLSRLAASSFGKLYAAKDIYSYLVWRDRRHIASSPSVNATTDATLTIDCAQAEALESYTTVEGAFTRVLATVHPRRLVLATRPVFTIGAAIPMGAWSTLTITGTFSDPTSAAQVIGAINVLPLSAPTDFQANSLADGSGADVTSTFVGQGDRTQVTVVSLTATSVVFRIDNLSGWPSYVTRLQLRGGIITQDDPISAESVGIDTKLGDQTIELDMPYQGDLNFAQDLADYTRASTLVNRRPIRSVSFYPRRTNALMLLALSVEVTDRLTVLNEPTMALVAEIASVHGIDITIRPGDLPYVTLSLAPYVYSNAWVLDSATQSQLDSTTVLGYF